jgi:hypothetical protein
VVAHTCNPALGRLRQEAYEFKAILGYKVSPCLKTKTNKQTKQINNNNKNPNNKLGTVAHTCKS